MSVVLDLAPAGAPAAPNRRVLAHARTEATLLVRNGEQLLLALVIPVGILVAGRLLGGQLGDLRVLAPSVLALALWSSAFTSTAIATGFERRYGVLERLAATPLRRTGLVVGKVLAVGAIAMGQLVVLTVLGVALGWRPRLTVLPTLLGVVAALLAVTAFVAGALTLAGRLRAEVTLGVANLVYLLLLVGGGLVLPLSRLGAAGPVLRVLPTAALGEALRALGAGTVVWWPLPVLVVWAVVLVLVARATFRWTS